MSSFPVSRRYDFVMDHISDLLAEAEEDRRAVLSRFIPLPCVWTGSLLIALGRVLIGAGEWVGGQPATWRI